MTMEIEIGIWKIILREKENYYVFDQVLCNGKDVDATEVNINIRMGEVPVITVYSRGRMVEEEVENEET